MQTGNQDIYALIPAYPDNHLALVTPSTDPCPQVPEFKCPERDRIFHQVGPWKRYIRKFHQIPCLNEDLFDPFEIYLVIRPFVGITTNNLLIFIDSNITLMSGFVSHLI